jgi:hypothetical protein
MDECETRQELFDKLIKQYHFDFDCCATAKNKKLFIITSINSNTV